MATISGRHADTKMLDQLRQRVVQLVAQIGKLNDDLSSPNLPQWVSLQLSANLIAGNLKTLLDVVNSNESFLSAAHAFPTSSFPGRTQSGLLEMLLRKRLDPRTEDWVDQGELEVKSAFEGRGQTTDTAGSSSITAKELSELWDWAGPAENEVARDIDWDDNYTLEEREAGVENVKTGLRRKLDEDDEDEDDESGQEKMVLDKTLVGGAAQQVVGSTKPMLPLEQIMRFMCTGQG